MDSVVIRLNTSEKNGRKTWNIYKSMHLPCHVWVWRVGSGTRWWLGRWSDPATGRSRLDRPVTGTFDRGSASPARKSGGWWRPSAISASSWPAGADWTAESDPTRYLKAAKKIKIQIILSFLFVEPSTLYTEIDMYCFDMFREIFCFCEDFRSQSSKIGFCVVNDYACTDEPDFS